MKEFQEKRKIRKMLFSPAILVMLLLILVFLSVSTAKVYLKSEAAVSKNDEAKREIAELEQRRAELENEIERLRSAFGVEEEIREKFNVQKPGEKVLMIVDKTDENNRIDLGEERRGFFSGVWHAIKNIF